MTRFLQHRRVISSHAGDERALETLLARYADYSNLSLLSIDVSPTERYVSFRVKLCDRDESGDIAYTLWQLDPRRTVRGIALFLGGGGGDHCTALPFNPLAAAHSETSFA